MTVKHKLMSFFFVAAIFVVGALVGSRTSAGEHTGPGHLVCQYCHRCIAHVTVVTTVPAIDEREVIHVNKP